MTAAESVGVDLDDFVTTVTYRTGGDSVDRLDGAVSNVSFVGIHVGQRDGFCVASKHLLRGLSSLHTDRFVPLGVALTRGALTALAAVSRSTVTPTVTPAIAVATATASASIIVPLSPTTTIVVSVGRVDIQTDVSLSKVFLHKATK
jgi:hypothetical protein